MFEAAPGVTRNEISAVREELRRFQNKQTDAAVQFHCIAIDTNLAVALERQNDPSFREILASNVERLAEAILTERHEKLEALMSIAKRGGDETAICEHTQQLRTSANTTLRAR